MSTLEIKKQLLTYPGDTIEETIEALGMSKAELAERLGRTPKFINDLLKGEASITQELAIKLEYVLGVPAKGWLALERKYQDDLLEIKKEEFKQTCYDWIKKFPLPHLKKNGIIPKTTDKNILVDSLLSFFRVATPEEWSKIYNEESLAFKIELRHATQPEAISTWLRMGELDVKDIHLSSFDKKVLKNCIPSIQELSYNMPSDWTVQLKQICASFGVALSLCQIMPKAPIYGAARWIQSKTIPLIQVTDRRKNINSFWFSFYHELGHIYLHGKKEIFLEGIEEIECNQEKEDEADNFARKLLMPNSLRKELETYFNLSVPDVIHLSKKYRVNPGIIVEQAKRLKIVAYSNPQFRSLMTKIEF